MRKSRIVLNLTSGNVVSTSRSDMMYVVTEHGIFNLKGKSVPERARAMISIAHPDFRDSLEREARAHLLIPRSHACCLCITRIAEVEATAPQAGRSHQTNAPQAGRNGAQAGRR